MIKPVRAGLTSKSLEIEGRDDIYSTRGGATIRRPHIHISRGWFRVEICFVICANFHHIRRKIFNIRELFNT